MTSPRASHLDCAACGEQIAVESSAVGFVVSADRFVNDHGECLTELAARGVLAEKSSSRRLRLIRDTCRRGHEGPYAMLRTLSEAEVEWLVTPLLVRIDELEDQISERSRVVVLPSDARWSNTDDRA
ncbi:MAG: hypothetical protein JWO88_1939 [Frankiales bacterium]|nr:hypothetical protein [Frankiales bacterium]